MSENDDAWRDYMFEDDFNDFDYFNAHDDEKKSLNDDLIDYHGSPLLS